MNTFSEIAAYAHRVTENVRFSETEMIGHVNNTVFPAYFEIGTRVSSAGRRSFGMEQILRQDDRIVGSLISTMVLIDMATSKSTPIPDSIGAILGL